MAARILFFIALLCAAKCNPLVKPTTCETPGLLSTLIPGYGAMYESPSLPYMPYSLGGLGLSSTVYENPANLHSLGYGLPYAPLAGPIATVCESAPNMLGMGGIDYGMTVSPLGRTTACETPNLLGLNYGIPYPASGASVCEPNGLGWGGMGLGGPGGLSPLPLGRGMGYPLAYSGLGAIGGVGTTTCDNNPNLLGMGYLGLGANGLGQVYETNPNLLGVGYYPGLLGVGLNGMAGYGLGGTLNPTTCEQAPNVLGLGLGHPCPRSFL